MGVVTCDCLVVGGGAAGCVVAARLSEDPSVRVVLIEAGADILHPTPPDDVRDLFPLATFNPAYTWPSLQVHWRTRSTSPAVPFQQARVMGGGSTIMGMWALRGVPEDYDGWAAAGAVGWGWDDVLPTFRRIEADKDFDGPLHGREGPIPIRRQAEGEWSPLSRAVAAAAAGDGMRTVADMNGDFDDGHCVLPISRTETSRAGAGICYLTRAVRDRKNLQILSGATATSLRFESRRVVGVTARAAWGVIEITASETILCAGAIYTPALLMRSGIGPGDVLAQAGVEVRVESPGVGANLQNHPLLLAFAWLNAAGRHARKGRPPASTYLRWTSSVAGATRGDMGMYVRSYLVWHALGRRMAMIGPVLMRPFSRGHVRLANPEPETDPVVEFNVLAHSADEERMVDGFRRAFALFASPHLSRVAGSPFVIGDASRLSRFNTLSRRNAILAGCAAFALDGLPWIGRRAVEAFARTTPLAPIAANENRLVDLVRSQTIGTNHVCGTARMGHADDPLAVADRYGRVKGVEGLIVADASIMPTVPSGNTHLPVVMAAERIAAFVLERRRRNG